MRYLRQLRDNEADTGKTIEQLRIFLAKNARAVTFSLHPYSGKWALRYYIHLNLRLIVGWLLSEKSRKIRVFTTADAAFHVARSFGQGHIKCDLENEQSASSSRISRSDAAPRVSVGGGAFSADAAIR